MSAPSWEELGVALEAIITADPRRLAEFREPWERLKCAGELAALEPRGVHGLQFVVPVPSPRLIALYESLRLRARLDLPQLDPPEE